MTFRNSSTSLTLWVRIDGTEGTATLLMLLDTGATFVAIPTYVAERLGYDIREPNETVATTTASGIARAPLVRLDAVETLGVELGDVAAICLDLPRSAQFRGLLGLSFLRNFDVDLHFKSGRIAFR